MIVICNIYKSVDDLLPHFYKHYVSLGVTDFAFGIFDGESNPAWNRVSELSFFGLTIHKTSSYQGIIDSQKEKESWIGLVEKFVKWGATSVSVSPDVVEKTRQIVYNAEHKLVTEKSKKS